jgi:uncharacterized membrane protein YcaP (DUF421 family)
MFDLSVGVPELMLRAVVVYLFLFTVMRFMGKKHVGDLAPFDLLVLLILSETVSNALTAGDDSLIGGLISAGTLLVLVHIINVVSWRSKKVERILEGTPTVLVRHGSLRKEAMAREHVTVAELLEALRRNGYANITNVRTAILENDGKISIVPQDSK